MTMPAQNTPPSDGERRQRRHAYLFPPDPWHRTVTVLCLLVCVGLVREGVIGLLAWDPAQSGEEKWRIILHGMRFIVIGVAVGWYLVRQMRTPRPKRMTRPDGKE